MTSGETLKVAKLKDLCNDEGVVFKPDNNVDLELAAMLENLHENIVYELLTRMVYEQ